MLSRTISGALLGVDAYLVGVEADVTNGIPTFATVGLPQGAVRESEKRVTAAIKNSGFLFPPKRITVNLAPADVRKEGSGFDLPIAIGILASTGQLRSRLLGQVALLGELGLDGVLRPVRGALSVAVAVRSKRLRGLILPRENMQEAGVVAGVEVWGARTLKEVVAFLESRADLVKPDAAALQNGADEADNLADFSDVQGQEHAKRAMEVAAAGAHNILMIGPPGSGKTMLARRLPGILPPLSLQEAIESTKIHSVAGTLQPGMPLVRSRPFRAPHHSISDAGLIGGGSNPKPGEASLAHNGVLFLDELPEFRRNVLEGMRQPMEDQVVTLARAGVSLSYPARFMLAAAMNPCPCGHHGSPHRSCTCPLPLVHRYMSRVSGPLLDRIDIHIEVPAVRHSDLLGRAAREPSSRVRARVIRARERQFERFARANGIHANAHMKPADLRRHCEIGEAGRRLLKAAVDRLGLSARAYHRILKIARTIADLDDSEMIGTSHVAEAIQYRSLDRFARG